MNATLTDYVWANYPEPHVSRTKEMVKKYPQIKKLLGHNPWTALLTFGIVSLQVGTIYAVRNEPWWIALIASFTIGATCLHALFVVIHDCAHNLVFKKSGWNKAISIFANLPGFFPAAIGFRNYHLLHHRFQGEMGWDADLPGPSESQFFGNSVFGKALWLLFFPVIEGIVRPLRVKKVNVIEAWGIANAFITFGFAALVAAVWGWNSFFYMGASLFFAVGLHPFGGRWIQEHFIFRPGQETYSYYGPLNKVALNVGYHNEHHDFMFIPWNRLPKLKALAPEFYDHLYSHQSWTKVLLAFIFDPNITLRSRAIRQDHDERKKSGWTTKETQKIIDQGKEEVATGNRTSVAVTGDAKLTEAPL